MLSPKELGLGGVEQENEKVLEKCAWEIEALVTFFQRKNVIVLSAGVSIRRTAQVPSLFIDYWCLDFFNVGSWTCCCCLSRIVSSAEAVPALPPPVSVPVLEPSSSPGWASKKSFTFLRA